MLFDSKSKFVEFTLNIIVDFFMPKGCPETGLPLSIYIFFFICWNESNI